MKFRNLISTSSGYYESFEGEVDGKPFRIGRNQSPNNLFQEDLKGNLTKEKVVSIFDEIDKLRKQHKLL